MEQEEVVMGVFGAFGKKIKDNVILTKIQSVSDHKHSQPIEIGTKIHGWLSYFPKIGESFNIENATIGNGYDQKSFGLWRTSIIVKFLPDNMIETKNSVYKYKIL